MGSSPTTAIDSLVDDQISRCDSQSQRSGCNSRRGSQIEDVAQLERAPVSDAGSHRYPAGRLAPTSPIILVCGDATGVACSENNKRTVAGLAYPLGRQSLQSSTSPPNLQVAKLARRWSAKPEIAGATPALESNFWQRSLTSKAPGSYPGCCGCNSRRCDHLHRLCNGNITVSKTVVPGSNPGLCVSTSAAA